MDCRKKQIQAADDYHIWSQHGKKKNHEYKKKAGTEPIHKKHKANRSMRTHVTKEHNNQDTTNTLI